MVYAVVIYPELKDDSKIQNLRKKYDSQFQLIKPHITLVFPFPDLEKEEIKSHLSKILKKFKPFKVSLEGLEKSFDKWLFLLINDGNDKIIELHDQLYTGMLKEYLRKDIKYLPHVGLGLFKTDEEYSKAETEARKMKLIFEFKVDKVCLIHLKDDLSNIDNLEEFSL